MTISSFRALGGLAVIAGLMTGGLALSASAATDADWGEKKQEMIELGKSRDSAWDLYQYFKEQADGGDTPEPEDLPDWGGLWERSASPFFFDPDQTSMDAPPTAKLTEPYQQELDERLARYKDGHDFDPISVCGVPTGHPRWLVEPFMREFIPKPHQTWLINENLNEIRRIYTDGRGHIPEEAQYPLDMGDSIGFWDDDKLVIHTNQLKSGIYQRIQPRHSEKAETVEVWQRVDQDTMQADVWVYDPEGLAEPWYTRQSYHLVDGMDGMIRIHYWACGENDNNTITETTEGGSSHTDFTFTDEDDE